MNINLGKINNNYTNLENLATLTEIVGSMTLDIIDEQSNEQSKKILYKIKIVSDSIIKFYIRKFFSLFNATYYINQKNCLGSLKDFESIRNEFQSKIITIKKQKFKGKTAVFSDDINLIAHILNRSLDLNMLIFKFIEDKTFISQYLLIQALCPKQHCLTITNDNGENALYLAIKNNDIKLFNFIVKKIKDPYTRWNGNFKKSFITANKDTGDTPLHLAIKKNQLDMITQLILVNGIENCCTIKNKKQQTPLHLAIKNNNVKALTIILNALKQKNDYIIQEIFNATNMDGDTPLHLAIKENNLEVIKALLAHQTININQENNQGDSPLYLAIKENNLEVIKALLAHQTINVNQENNQGDSPLHLAIKKQNLEVIKALLAHQTININQENNQGDSPLHLAIKKQNLEVINALLQKPNIDVNKFNTFTGFTPLHIAIFQENLTIIRALLQNSKIDVNIKDKKSQRSPLLLSTHTESIQLLLTHSKIKINTVVPGTRDTALHFACKDANNTTVQILSQLSSININSKNEQGNTPLHIALQRLLTIDPQTTPPEDSEKYDGLIQCIMTLLNNDNIDIRLKNKKDISPVDLVEELTKNPKIKDKIVLIKNKIDILLKKAQNVANLITNFMVYYM